MPRYEFICESCKKEFEKVLHITELEKGGIKCPNCGSENVHQEVTAFAAVTPKKS